MLSGLCLMTHNEADRGAQCTRTPRILTATCRHSRINCCPPIVMGRGCVFHCIYLHLFFPPPHSSLQNRTPREHYQTFCQNWLWVVKGVPVRWIECTLYSTFANGRMSFHTDDHTVIYSMYIFERASVVLHPSCTTAKGWM